jgi:hypothetical protein
MKIKVRYNTNYGKIRNGVEDTKKWRVLVDDKQYFVNEVRIISNSVTTKDTVTGDDGQPVEKYHVSSDVSDHMITENFAAIGYTAEISEYDIESFDYKLNWKESDKMWRLLTEDGENLLNEIEINCPCRTIDNFIAVKAKNCVINNLKATLS